MIGIAKDMQSVYKTLGKHLWVLFAVFLAARIADSVTTLQGLYSSSGANYYTEENPIAKFFFDFLGLTPGIILFNIFVICPVFAIFIYIAHRTSSDDKKFAWGLLWFITLGMILIAIYNYTLIHT